MQTSTSKGGNTEKRIYLHEDKTRNNRKRSKQANTEQTETLTSTLMSPNMPKSYFFCNTVSDSQISHVTKYLTHC